MNKPIDNRNMALWERLFETPPSHTKPFRRAGGFQGTAIKPYYCIERATAEFGPHGKGWGHDEIEHEIFKHSDGQAVWMSKVVVWYEHEGVKYTTGPQWGQTMLVARRSSGEFFVDEEAPKKAITDGLTKCLSYLGIGGDVHMGMFDDSKYVAEARVEERKEKEREEHVARKAKKAAPQKEDSQDSEPEAEGKGGNGELDSDDEPFDPPSWRDKVCAEVKLLKTEKAVRNFWGTRVKSTVDRLMADTDEERRKIALYVHSKIRDRLHEVKEGEMP